MYEAKGRGEEKPLQLLLAEPDWLERVAGSVSSEAERLAAAFFPGGITRAKNNRNFQLGARVEF